MKKNFVIYGFYIITLVCCGIECNAQFITQESKDQSLILELGLSGVREKDDGPNLNGNYQYLGYHLTATYLKKVKNHFITGTVTVSNNENVEPDYPYYLFDKSILAVGSGILIPINKASRLSTLIGGDIILSFHTRPLLKDFTVSDGFTISIPQPNATNYSVPLIHPKFDIQKKWNISPGISFKVYQEFYKKSNVSLGASAIYNINLNSYQNLMLSPFINIRI